MTAVTIHSDFGAQEKKNHHCFQFFFPPPSICYDVMGLDALSLWFFQHLFSFLVHVKVYADLLYSKHVDILNNLLK